MHLASLEQQRELMRYMNSLNEWLGHDVGDRQAEIRGITDRLDRLDEDLARLGLFRGPCRLHYAYDCYMRLIKILILSSQSRPQGLEWGQVVLGYQVAPELRVRQVLQISPQSLSAQVLDRRVAPLYPRPLRSRFPSLLSHTPEWYPLWYLMDIGHQPQASLQCIPPLRPTTREYLWLRIQAEGVPLYLPRCTGLQFPLVKKSHRSYPRLQAGLPPLPRVHRLWSLSFLVPRSGRKRLHLQFWCTPLLSLPE
jgi:hypothetical protein